MGKPRPPGRDSENDVLATALLLSAADDILPPAVGGGQAAAARALGILERKAYAEAASPAAASAMHRGIRPC